MGFIYKEFSKMRQSKMSQEELSEASGVGLSTIKNIECGRRKAKEEDIKLLCDTLKIKFNDYWKKDSFVLTLLSNKGGSTKTTTSANLAYSLATEHNKKILLMDIDSQQNLSQHYNMSVDDKKNIYVAFSKNQSIINHIRPTDYDNIDIVCSHDSMALLETEIINMDLRELRMRSILKDVIESGIYDFIICDCNPTLSLINKATLYATDAVIVPLEPSAFGQRGLEFVVKFISDVRINHDKLTIMGVLVNRFDARKRVPKDVVENVEEKFGDRKLLFKTRIPEDTAISQCQMLEEPLGVSFKKSRANLAFIELAGEVLKRSEDVIKNG